MSEIPKDLYRRSVRAAQRYFTVGIKSDKHRTELSRAVDTARFEMYRAGWMIGWQAGNKARKRK